MNSVTKEIAASIICIATVEAMWKDLKEWFSQDNAPHIFQLQKTMSALSQGTSSVSAYYTQLKGL